MDVRVPSMILQPLVENAVNYGIRGIDWEGRIELSVCRREKQISISIWDNGAGMEQERIRRYSREKPGRMNGLRAQTAWVSGM